MNLGTRSTQKLVEMHNGQSIFLFKFWLICLYVNVVFVFIYHLIQLWVITCPLSFYCLLLDLFFVTYRLHYTVHKIRVGKPTNHDIKFICCRSSICSRSSFRLVSKMSKLRLFIFTFYVSIDLLSSILFILCWWCKIFNFYYINCTLKIQLLFLI